MDSFWILVTLLLSLLPMAQQTMTDEEFFELQLRSREAIRSGDETQVQIIVDELQH